MDWRKGLGLEIGRGEHDNCGLCSGSGRAQECLTITADLFADHFRPDVFCDAQCLPFKRGSLDFVASAHVLEHVVDPIGAILDWICVVRTGGYIYLNLPSKDRMFDSNRPCTTIAELESRRGARTCFKDLPLSSYDDLATRKPSDWSGRHLPHHNVWMVREMVELVDWMRRTLYVGVEVVEANEYANAPDRENSFEVLIRITA